MAKRPVKKATRKAPAKRKPVWKEVEEREQRKVSSRLRQNRKYKRRRLAVVYDVNGPRIRLGMGWFALTLLALAGGRWTVAALYAATAAFAALQTAREWRKGGARPHRPLAGAGALVIGLTGAVSTQLVGVAILGFVGAALFVAFSSAAASRGKSNPLNDAAFTIRCGLFAGFAAACVATTARYSLTAVVGLVFIVAAYEIGDYVVGSGAHNPFEGPVAGATAIVVTTFAITAIGLKPFVFPGSFALAGLAAALCPAGQVLASVILPKVDAPASALRRIDSLLLLAPAWALVVGHLV
ncbi:MAG: hypothetical protein QOD92_4097 [Acidimicrobiaceae bacterium]|jgi:hypothetical protein